MPLSGDSPSANTGAILTEQNGAYALLGVMLFSSAMALIAALYVIRIDRCERREHPANPA